MDTKTLEALLAPAVGVLGYEWIGCELGQHGHGALLRVYIDAPDGVTVDDCAVVSRQVSAILAVEPSLQDKNYTLEVSSPGLDRPLFTLEHFQQFLGREVNIQLHVPEDGRRNFKGSIKNVISDQIVVTLDGVDYTFRIAQIKKAKLVPNNPW